MDVLIDRGRLRVSWGRREWELQAQTEGGYMHWSGYPYLTRREAERALPTWQRYDFFYDVVARNTVTGEVIR